MSKLDPVVAKRPAPKPNRLKKLISKITRKPCPVTLQKGNSAMSMPTIINLLLDDSGSMQSVIRQTVAGFNTYLDTLRGTDKEVDVSFTFTLFGSAGHYVERFKDVRIDKVPYLTSNDYRPNSGTQICSALDMCITQTEAMLDKRGGRANVVVVLQTDGEDGTFNNSTKAAIEKKMKQGWKFIFMASSPSATHFATNMGFDPSMVSYYNSSTASDKAFENLADNTVKYVHSGSNDSLKYSDDQRRRQG